MLFFSGPWHGWPEYRRQPVGTCCLTGSGRLPAASPPPLPSGMRSATVQYMAESLAWGDHCELPTENRQAMADRTDTRRVGTSPPRPPRRRSPSPAAARLAPTGPLLLRKARTGQALRVLYFQFAAIIPPAGLPLPGLRRRLSDIPACLTGT